MGASRTKPAKCERGERITKGTIFTMVIGLIFFHEQVLHVHILTIFLWVLWLNQHKQSGTTQLDTILKQKLIIYIIYLKHLKIVLIQYEQYTECRTAIKTYIRIITSNHLSIWNLMAQAICGLIGINWHVQDIWRLHGQECIAQVWAECVVQSRSLLVVVIHYLRLSVPGIQLAYLFIFFFLGESSSEPFLPLPLDPRFSRGPLESPSVFNIHIY